MLIQSLEALHFQKYKKLIINDIPESGVIALSGKNESSRISISDAICFALFGRTPLQDEQTLHHIIHPKSQYTEVTLTFKANGDKYSLWRKVNQKGNIEIKLIYLDEQITIENIEEVNKTLENILGVTFDNFSHFFCLTQTEAPSVSLYSDTLTQLAGISDYTKITETFTLSNQKNEALITELQPKVIAKQEKLDNLGLDETWLPELIDAEETLQKEKKSRTQLSKELNDKENFYVTHHAKFHSNKNTFFFFSFITKAALFLSLFFGVVYSLNHYYPAQFILFLTENFSKSVNIALQHFTSNKLIHSGIAALGVSAFSWILCKKSKWNMARLNNDVKSFTQLLNIGHEYARTLTETPLPERVVRFIYENNNEEITSAHNSSSNTPKEPQLFDSLENYSTYPNEMSSTFKKLVESVETQENEVRSFNDKLLNAINVEKKQAEKAGNLRSKVQKINKEITQARYSIDKQNLAIDMMQRAGTDFIQQFNQKLADISEKPQVERCSNDSQQSMVKLTEDFSIQSLSNDRGDYLNIKKASTKSQHAALLVLKIATAEQISIRLGHKESCIFLNIPSHFNKQSTEAYLENLPNMSTIMQQIWVSAPTLPNTHVAKKIQCSMKKGELIT